MQANLWVKIEIDEEERKRIEDAVKLMDEIADCYAKVNSDAIWAANQIRDGASVLRGVLEGEYV